MAYNPPFPPGPSYTSASTLGAPPGFVPPTNWNASTVRFTPDTHQPNPNSSNFRGPNAEPLGNGNPRRSGLGAPRDDNGRLDRERQAVRESMAALQPPTREEVARTIFVGGLGEGCPGDEALEEVLRCAGKLRRWTRARDADDVVCKFGFAEYEDVDSLDAANVIFEGGVEVPVFSKDGGVVREGDAGQVKTMKLLIVVDEASRKYIQEWKGRGREDEDARQFRLDGCREDLRQCVTGITNAASYAANNGLSANGDTAMSNGIDDPLPLPGNGITLPGLEDELSDIPAEMRATVAGEIRSFRDRSTRRDLERMKMEEAMGASERREGALGRRLTPPLESIPSGPRGQTGGIRGGNVPQGPRARGGAQLPSDYVNGVAFVGANGGTNGVNINREDEDAEESDDELERKRQAVRTEDLDRQYADLERKHLNRERQRNAALAREKAREDEEGGARERENDMIRVRLAEWDDEEEVRLGREEYYSDRAGWLRKRGMWRAREEREDERDRRAEEEEKAREAGTDGNSVEMADAFLEQTGAELQQRKAGPSAAVGGQGVKISLGSAAARQRGPAATASAVPKRGMAEIESLLEDEEDAARQGIGKRTLNLKPIADLPHTHQQQQDLSDSERAAARQALAAEIPTTTAELFATPLNYTYLTPSIIENEIRPFVVKKVVEYLGVQEDLLVDTVVGGLRERKGGAELVGELEGALEEEAEVMVRRVWRLGVFWGEAGARGLN
ncbi:hypothetical protein LTR22_009411 [Elasticomyces elasticus]|nr:hypothetical protein LTR22_009411 [Elasticomyces elasticus]KAK4922216.1 hypothetical protein LTR49_010437 [Elasticomyces elasticus]KAK5760845.1 hypothetical protein LTS12_009021 [Elasticomyces elasticus]